MDNPFIIKSYESKDLFCDREKELQLMLRNCVNQSDMTLISQRRMGKTGLILRLFDELKTTSPDIHTIYLDIFASRNIDDFIKLLAEATMKSFPVKTSIGERLMKFIKSLRPQLSFDNITGEPQLQIAYQTAHEKEYTLRGLFDFLDSQEAPIVIAIDEFQQIRDYPEQNMEALLRTYIQQMHNLTFIFCGSKKHLMADIFTNEKKPFYASTSFVSLSKIDEAPYTAPLEDAVSKYTTLTIGDGLASQVPSLLMSIAAGIFMTRSSAADSLGMDVTGQIMSKPNALFLAAGFLLLLAATSGWTGLPWAPFTIFSIGLGIAGFSTLINADVQSQLGQLENVRQNMQDLVNPNRMYERLGVDVLSLQVGSNLLVIADPDQEGQLLAKIAALRQRITDELGYILPNIRIMDSSALDANEYMLSIRGNTVATGYVYPGKFMVIADQWDAVRKEVPQDAIIGIDPTYQTQAYWISPEEAKMARSVTAVDSTDVIVTHLQECVRKHVDEVMTKTDVLKLMELVRSQDPTLVNDLVPTIISTSDLRKIFVNLIREKVSIKDIIFVFERLCDYARFSKEPDILSERLRAALGRQICLSNVSDDKILYALTLSPEWEKTLDDSCQRTELGTMFLLNPMQVQELIETTATTLMRAHQACGQQPVILCSPRIRLPLYQLLERHIPTIVVISYSELITDIKVEAVDTIGESYAIE